MSPLEQFLEKLRASLDASTFVKLTLSQPRSGDSEVRNVHARVVDLREGCRLSLVYRYATRDVTKNFVFSDALARIGETLGAEFERAHLFTTAGDWQLRCERRHGGRLTASQPAFTVVPAAAHDRIKPQRVAREAAWLQALGVTNAAREPRPGMADKLRQIERFVEILGHLLDDSPLRGARELRVIDMGAGKGYLTFAAYDFLRSRGITAEVTGVEMRTDLVELTANIARDVGFEGLRFVRGAINDFTPADRVDLLIALHACDTATDDALHLAIRASASLVLTSPCCHKELRSQLAPPPVLRDVLRHGILLEREAEIITDAIRAQLLEIHGYKASVFEFVSTEHTGKNLMIAAHKRAQPIDAVRLRKGLRELLTFYGVREQRLARLLREL